MAKRKYKPYPTRKQQKNRRMRNVAMVLIAMIVGIVIFNRKYKTDTTVPEKNGSQTVSLNDVLPSKTSDKDAKPVHKPITVLNPSIASAEPAMISEPAPKPKPVAEPKPEPLVKPEPIQKTPPAEVKPPAPPANPKVALADPDAGDDDSSKRAKELIDESLRLRDSNKIVQARELLNDTLNEKLSPTLRSAVKFQLTKLAEDWLFSPVVFPEDKLTGTYLVQRGDLLQRIAKQYKVPYESLMQINNIARPQQLQAGQTIKVIQGPFNVVVYKSSFTMDLYLQNRYIKTFRVGLGRDEYETPSGRWRVESGGKLIKPTWTDPDTGRRYVGDDPDYPLGARWIAIEGVDEATRKRTGFAIHGTKDPGSIGTRSSRGCIRLHNSDVVEVYDLLYGGISEVLVMD